MPSLRAPRPDTRKTPGGFILGEGGKLHPELKTERETRAVLFTLPPGAIRTRPEINQKRLSVNRDLRPGADLRLNLRDQFLVSQSGSYYERGSPSIREMLIRFTTSASCSLFRFFTVRDYWPVAGRSV